MKLKFVAILLTIMLLVSFFPHAVSAYTINKGKIISSGVNMRSGASATSSVVAKLNGNTVVKIFRTNVNAEWYEVEANGKRGFVNRMFVNWDECLPAYKGDYTATVVNVSAFANARKKPNAESEVVGEAKKGETFKVVDKNPGGGWVCVDFNGTSAYINSQYLSLRTAVENDQLISLSVSGGEMSPAFAPSVYGYFVECSQERQIIRCEANKGVSVKINNVKTTVAALDVPNGSMKTVRIELNGKIEYTIYFSRGLLKVGTYNIKRGNGNLLEMGNQIRNRNPDILAFQEVYCANKSTRVNNLESLRTRRAQNYKFAPAAGGGTYGNGIISRYKFISTENFKLPTGGLEQRALQKVVVNIGGKVVSIYNTHLTYQTPSVRMPQYAEISRIIKADKNKYKIIFGDFNSGFAEYAQLGTDYKITNTPATKFLDYKYNPIKKNVIDNIIVTKNIRVVNAVMTPKDKADFLSDHAAIFAYIAF